MLLQKFKQLSSFQKISALSFLCLLILLILRPQVLAKYSGGLHAFYDTEHYVTIAMQGYGPSLEAFYPLWPFILAIFGFLLGIEEPQTMGFLAGILSTVLGLVSVKMLLTWLEKHLSTSKAYLITLLYALGPTAAFRFFGYTESLSACLFLGLLYTRSSFSASCLLAFLLCLARPLGFILPLAALTGMLFTVISAHRKNEDLWWASSLILGGVLGFGGICCIHYFDSGNPFAHLDAQETWGRKLGLYWELIYAPKSVGGSDQVRFWDMAAFYGPFAMAIVACLRTYRDRTYLGSDNLVLVFWICLAIAMAHGAISFLTYPIFASTSRHILGQPMFYIALGLLLKETVLPRRVEKLLIISHMAFFIRWWVRFVKGSWIG